MLANRDEVESIVLRGHPCLLFVDGERMARRGPGAGAALKADPFTAIVPVTVLAGAHDPEAMQEWFAAGADEILTGGLPPGGAAGPARRAAGPDPARRVGASLAPGCPEPRKSSGKSAAGWKTGEEFAVCYADLDHFKEFNDRYSYYDGDRVIYILSRILHDVVKGLLGTGGSSGTSAATISSSSFRPRISARSCGEILAVFDTLVPFQYNEQDRRAGYFFGKDRRGQLHRVPLMTLSIGIVTNRHRQFAHPARGQRAGDRNEELRQDPARFGVCRRPPARAASGGRGVTGREPRESAR